MPAAQPLSAPFTADALDRTFVALVQGRQVKVPPYPAVAFRIQALVQGNDYGLEELAAIVSSDQVISADVLRRANAADQARGNPVTSVKQAVARAGAKEVARIALASALGAHALRAGPLAPLRRRIWVDSLASAVLCQALARGRGLAPDVAFSAGLLHDFGKVVALACLEELLGSGPGLPARSAEAWEAVVEAYHVELGVVMAARWELPPVLADVISQHHAPSIVASSDPRYVETVAAVDQVVALLGDRPRVGVPELAEADLVAEDERELVARTVETVPAYVAAFEAGVAPPAGAGADAVAPPPPPGPGWGAEPSAPHPVKLRHAGKEHQCRLQGLGATQCVVAGPVRLPDHVVLELEVGCEPPLRGFARVKLAWAEQGGWKMLLQPFGLTDGAAARWQGLSAQAGR